MAWVELLQLRGQRASATYRSRCECLKFEVKRTGHNLVVRVLGRLSRAVLSARGLWCASRIRPASGESRVSYFSKAYPLAPAGDDGFAFGGEVKLTYLQREFPHSPHTPNILYLVSSVIRDDVLRICRIHQARGVRTVLNQNGLYYPAWFGEGWEARNKIFKDLIGCADFVIYQSRFCQRACDELLMSKPKHSAVLHNPVDLHHFYPRQSSVVLSGAPVLLTIAPPLRQFYRLTSAIGALAFARKELPETRMLIAGVDRAAATWSELSDILADSLRHFGLSENAVELLPKYSRSEAPAVFAKANIFLHTACNDPCPNVVVEALASGLPVVFSATGGVPELVSHEAGVGVESDCNWERFCPPAPEALGAAVVAVNANRKQLGVSARHRAESRFSVEEYLKAHRKFFERSVTGNYA